MESEHELEEAAEKAREPFDRVVGATMATVAVVLALVSVLGQMKTTEELLAQQKASDQWAYYQAKNIREHSYEMFLDHVLPEDRAEVDRKFQTALQEHGNWDFECRIVRTDGEQRWIWACGRHSQDAQGRYRRVDVGGWFSKMFKKNQQTESSGLMPTALPCPSRASIRCCSSPT